MNEHLQLPPIPTASSLAPLSNCFRQAESNVVGLNAYHDRLQRVPRRAYKEPLKSPVADIQEQSESLLDGLNTRWARYVRGICIALVKELATISDTALPTTLEELEVKFYEQRICTIRDGS